MWICLSDAFLSVVAVPNHPELLKVRARRKGDIEQVFPGTAVKRTPGRDYLYRSEICRNVVMSTIAASLEAVAYDNFKNSVRDQCLHAAYATVWTTMSRLQEVPPYATSSGRTSI